MLSDEAELIMKNLKVKQTKSFFTSMAIKHFSMTKEGKNFLKDIESFEPKSKAEKNTSVAGQTGRELSLLKKELERRRKGN